MNGRTKRILSIVLTLCMLVSLFPATALGLDAAAQTQSQGTEVVKGSSIPGTGYHVTSVKNYSIAPDISERVIITNNDAGNSQTVANVMEVNTSGGRAKIVAGYGNRNPKEQGWTLKTTTDQAHVYEKESGLNVVGGVNASWFNINTGEPSGYLVMNGVVHHDNYYKPHDDLPFEARTKLNYDCPDAFETPLLAQQLRQLRLRGQLPAARSDHILCRHHPRQQLPGHAVCGGGVEAVAGEEVTGCALRDDAAVLRVNNHGVFTSKVLAQLNSGVRFLGLKYSGLFLRFLHRIINGCRCCGLFAALFRLVLEAPGSQEPYKNDQHQTEGKKLLQLPLTPGSLFLTSCFRTLGPTGGPFFLRKCGGIVFHGVAPAFV
mgnify:CR=1 FL=1